MIDKLTKSRAGLILDHPFFGSLALRLKLVEDESCGTSWVDGTTLGYSPEYVNQLNLDQLKGLICHAVMHCGLQHHTRRGDRDQDLWNTACDYAVNPIILSAGMVLPDDALTDKQYDGLSAEQIYAIINQDSEETDDGSKDGKGNKCKSGCGEVRDAKGEDGKKAGEAAMRQADQEWKVAMTQAVQQARAAGSLPGSLERVMDDILNPRLDWREIFRRFVDSVSKNDYSWSRPNRRWINRGVYLPALHSNELGHVVAVIDTSGSISQALLDQFAGEINSILQDYRANCTVIYCDTEVKKVDYFQSGDPVNLQAKGGGGTDFRPPFDFLDNSEIRPVCLLYFTDGVCRDFPPIPPEYPVLWVQKETKYSDWVFDPPFGDVLKLV